MVNHLRLEDRLEGASNFSSWKIRVMIILREMELEEYIETNISMPENEPKKVTWKRHNNKAMKIIIDSVKDHIPCLVSSLHLRCSPLFEIHLKSTILVDY